MFGNQAVLRLDLGERRCLRWKTDILHLSFISEVGKNTIWQLTPDELRNKCKYVQPIENTREKKDQCVGKPQLQRRPAKIVLAVLPLETSDAMEQKRQGTAPPPVTRPPRAPSRPARASRRTTTRPGTAPAASARTRRSAWPAARRATAASRRARRPSTSGPARGSPAGSPRAGRALPSTAEGFSTDSR